MARVEDKIIIESKTNIQKEIDIKKQQVSVYIRP